MKVKDLFDGKLEGYKSADGTIHIKDSKRWFQHKSVFDLVAKVDPTADYEYDMNMLDKVQWELWHFVWDLTMINFSHNLSAYSRDLYEKRYTHLRKHRDVRNKKFVKLLHTKVDEDTERWILDISEESGRTPSAVVRDIITEQFEKIMNQF